MPDEEEKYGKSPLLEIIPTLEQYNKLLLNHLNYEVMHKEIADLMGYNYGKKSTRWTRLKWRIGEFFERLDDAWEVLKGNRIDYD